MVPHPLPAIVSKPTLRSDEPAAYLKLNDKGAEVWTSDLLEVTTFPSMADAARAALRLPAARLAFGLPLRSELLTQRLH